MPLLTVYAVYYDSVNQICIHVGSQNTQFKEITMISFMIWNKLVMNWDTALFVVVKCKIIVYKVKESDIEDCYELRL